MRVFENWWCYECYDDKLCSSVSQVAQGIRERIDFLNDMESLGMGKKYRPIIQQEIAQKIRLMESLDNQTSDQLRKEEFYEVKDERPSSKLFPLTEPGQNWFFHWYNLHVSAIVRCDYIDQILCVSYNIIQSDIFYSIVVFQSSDKRQMNFIDKNVMPR